MTIVCGTIGGSCQTPLNDTIKFKVDEDPLEIGNLGETPSSELSMQTAITFRPDFYFLYATFCLVPSFIATVRGGFSIVNTQVNQYDAAIENPETDAYQKLANSITKEVRFKILESSDNL